MRDIKIIKIESEYLRALSRIEALMDSKPGTSAFDELEILTVLVEKYEDARFPVDMPDPIDAIKFRMDQMGMDAKDLIPLLGSRSRVSEVLNRKRRLSYSMIRTMHSKLGIPAEVLLQDSRESVFAEWNTIDWRRFPIREMQKRGWIDESLPITGNEAVLMKPLIADAGNPVPVFNATFRKCQSQRKSERTDPYALAAWCLRALGVARQKSLSCRYKPEAIDMGTLRYISSLSVLKDGPRHVGEFLDKLGVHLIILRHLQKTYLDGASLLLENGTPIVALTLRYDRIDNFWFCLMHELAHIWKHLSLTNTSLIVDDLDIKEKMHVDIGAIEREADEIAKESLIPTKEWEGAKSGLSTPESQMVSLGTKLRIHPAIIAGRIRYERNNFRILARHLGTGEVRRCFEYV